MEEITEQKLKERPVEKGFFGAKYIYLDDNTRVRFGFRVWYLGRIYELERKKRFCWYSVAWTYAILQTNEMKNIIDYLFWYEEDEKKDKNTCLF